MVFSRFTFWRILSPKEALGKIMTKSKTLQIKKDILKYHREKCGITQECLAAITEQSTQNIKKIERDGRTTIATAIKIAKSLDTSLETLTGENEPLLKNYWLRDEAEKQEPGILFKDVYEMLSWIESKINQCTPIHPYAHLKRHIIFNQSDIYATFEMKYHVEQDDLYPHEKKIKFHICKIIIDDNMSIKNVSMNQNQSSILQEVVFDFLMKKSTSFEFNGELYEEGNCYSVTVYNEVDSECHTCPSTTFEDTFFNRSGKSIARTAVDHHIFEDRDDCLGALHCLINAEERCHIEKFPYNNTLIILLFRRFAPITHIHVNRNHRQKDGTMVEAPFPHNATLADAIQKTKNTVQLNPEEMQLSKYPSRKMTWNY